MESLNLQVHALVGKLKGPNPNERLRHAIINESPPTRDPHMNELRFEENLAIREVLDDIIGMVDRREKLISSASEKAENTRDERMAQHIKKLEELMSDFLVLFNPILDKIRSYSQSLKESISDSEAYLKSLTGIIEAGKTIEGTSATLQELEKDADGVQAELEQSSDTLEKIEDLFRRTKQYSPTSSAARSEDTERASTHRSSHLSLKSDVAQDSRSHVLTGTRFSSHESSKSQH